jgi:hypothetical protein
MKLLSGTAESSGRVEPTQIFSEEFKPSTGGATEMTLSKIEIRPLNLGSVGRQTSQILEQISKPEQRRANPITPQLSMKGSDITKPTQKITYPTITITSPTDIQRTVSTPAVTPLTLTGPSIVSKTETQMAIPFPFLPSPGETLLENPPRLATSGLPFLSNIQLPGGRRNPSERTKLPKTKYAPTLTGVVFPNLGTKYKGNQAFTGLEIRSPSKAVKSTSIFGKRGLTF